MSRKCYNCNRDLVNEPAVDGLQGVLCFPCRYNFDQQGGEQWLFVLQEYQNKYAQWKAKYELRWNKFNRYNQIIGRIESIIFCVIIILFFILASRNSSVDFFIPSIIIFFVLGGFFYWWIDKKRGPSPPQKPSNRFLGVFDPVPLDPKVFLDDETVSGEGEKYADSKKWYPQDWDIRKDKCLARDGNRCRLCGAVERLHIHHVKPISFGGSHNMQNLLTLCGACHLKQRYYQHDYLIEKGIKANKKYFVDGYIRDDGVKVAGYFRHIGRRGNFWK